MSRGFHVSQNWWGKLQGHPFFDRIHGFLHNCRKPVHLSVWKVSHRTAPPELLPKRRAGAINALIQIGLDPDRSSDWFTSWLLITSHQFTSYMFFWYIFCCAYIIRFINICIYIYICVCVLIMMGIHQLFNGIFTRNMDRLTTWCLFGMPWNIPVTSPALLTMNDADVNHEANKKNQQDMICR